jgi:hypothetical protein
MSERSRDSFDERTKRDLAARVNSRCSNPQCRAPTSGPQDDPEKAVNLGVAAHITAASDGGPRFDPSITPDERSAASNGIWLCQNCAKEIDNDVKRFTPTLLREWKDRAEHDARVAVGKAQAKPPEAPKIEDEWVDLKYPADTGIQKQLEKEGYSLGWATAKLEARKLDAEGYEHVLVKWRDGRTVRLKIRDASAGGYLVLLKKRKG